MIIKSRFHETHLSEVEIDVIRKSLNLLPIGFMS